MSSAAGSTLPKLMATGITTTRARPEVGAGSVDSMPSCDGQRSRSTVGGWLTPVSGTVVSIRLSPFSL